MKKLQVDFNYIPPKDNPDIVPNVIQLIVGLGGEERPILFKKDTLFFSKEGDRVNVKLTIQNINMHSSNIEEASWVIGLLGMNVGELEIQNASLFNTATWDEIELRKREVRRNDRGTFLHCS